MQKIKFRTKVEAIGAIIFVALLVVVSAAAVTRTITDSADNSYTFIRNSNGKYWEATGTNLQAAIDDLRSTGGTVWVGSDVTLSSELRIGNYTIVDFENHKVTLGGDISFINVTGGVWYSQISNVRVLVSNGQTRDIMVLYAPPNGGWAYRARFNLFENIQILNSYANNNGWTGIHLYLNVGADNPNGRASFFENTFRKITIGSCKNGILLECDDCDAYGNGNTFDNIYIDSYETGVYFKVDTGATNGFNENLFNDVTMQTATWSIDGFKNIAGDGNHFDHCLVWDWYGASNPGHDWSVSNKASKTYICANYIANILDQGSQTKIDMS